MNSRVESNYALVENQFDGRVERDRRSLSLFVCNPNELQLNREKKKKPKYKYIKVSTLYVCTACTSRKSKPNNVAVCCFK